MHLVRPIGLIDYFWIMVKEKVKKTIKGFTLPELRKYFISEGEPAFRAEQVFKWMYGDMVDEF